MIKSSQPIPLENDNNPRVLPILHYNDCKVTDRWCFVINVWVGNWSWRVPPRGRAIDELSSLISLIGNLSLDSNGTDKWIWTGDASGKFKVSSLTKSIQNFELGDSAVGYHHFRNPWIPRKGVNISTNLCPICDNAIEEIKHSIINCSRAITIWRKVWSWWCLSPPLFFPSFTISNIASNRTQTLGCPRLNKILHGVVTVTVWAIWKWMNRIVNATLDTVSSIREEDIFPSIQMLSKLRISARLKSHIANMSLWISKHFDLFKPLDV
ncbi:hypothetical protein Tco_1138095 [Tanacetum coccineum]